MGIKLDLGLGINSGGGVRPDYALEFNGTDEYLQIALPNNIASGNTNDWISSGSKPSTWSESGVVTWDSTQIGTTGSYCVLLTRPGGGAVYFSIPGLTVGKKYKLKIRYKGSYLYDNTQSGAPVYYEATSEWNIKTKVFTALWDYLIIAASVSSLSYIDSIHIKEDQGFDLNKDQEQILHSKNWDFERTLGTELASGTVTIGSKYIVTAGTVEGNAVGTEFLAVTNATTLDASNKVKPIPNLATATFTNNGSYPFETFTGASAQGFTAVETAGRGVASAGFSFQVGKRYRFSWKLDVNAINAATGIRFILASGTALSTVDNTLNSHTTTDGTGTFIKSIDFTITQSGQIYYGFRVEDTQTADFVVSGFHFYEIPEWTASGNHTGDVSTLDKSGTTGQSMLVTASGAGDSTTNYVSLPSANLESCVSGKKYTLEGFARLDASSLTFGSNLLTGDGTTGWTAGSGTGAEVGGEYVLSSTSSGYIYRNINVTSGKVIKVVFKAKSAGYTGAIRVYHNATTNAISTGNIGASYQTFTLYLIGQGNYTFYIQLLSNYTGDVVFDDIEIYESSAVAPTLTAQFGTKSVTSSALSIVAGTFTKFVLNFEATASEQSQDLKLYLSGAGSVFVDKLSLTQAYDFYAIQKVKLTDTGAFGLWRKSTALGSVAATGIGIWGTSTLYYFDVFSETGNAGAEYSRAKALIPDNQWNNIAFKIDRTTNIQYGTVESLVTQVNTTIGKIITNSNAFVIAAYDGITANFQGQISHLQIIRFENISQSTFNSALTGLQYPTGGGAEEVLRLTFQSGLNITECLKDYSPKGHTVSGVNVDISNRKRVTA